MRAEVVALLTSLGAVACLATESEPADADSPSPASESAVEGILENPLADGDYREEKSCLWQRQIDSVEIIDENFVIFRGRLRNKMWLNQFTQPCIGLRRDMLITTRARTGSICRFDTLDARPRGASPFGSAVRCYLGTFEAIDEVQAEAMKKAVEEHAKAGGTSDRPTRTTDPGPAGARRYHRHAAARMP